MPPVLLRYASLILALIIGTNLLYGRKRAAALVKAGRITQDELDGFVRGVAVLVGGFFLLGAVFQLLGSVPDLACLMSFPPQSPASLIMWIAQAGVSGWIIWWLWTQDGGRSLATIAPAFTRGPILERHYSPQLVRLGITALVILAPLGNIAVQLTQPMFQACAAI